MAKLNLEFYKGNDLYTDGDIEEKMLELAQKCPDIDDFADQEFPIVYHFSKIRHNILSWYPFRKGCKILEIGAGCGALTGLLCEKASRVVSIELSYRRSRINYERHKKYTNLEIIVGNMQDVELPEQFDYIIVNGVLEYAISFTSGDTPYEDFLNSLCAYLNVEGRILISIENRLGLKYFAGAPEDHTENFFLGLQGYEGNNTVRTFSKSELAGLLEKVGLVKQKFYYPFPDYKFPREIFTEEYLTEDMVGSDYYSIGAKRFYMYDEARVAESLASQGIMEYFMNSFLVEASKGSVQEDVNVKFVKYSDDRLPEYRIMTKIVDIMGKRHAVKQPLENSSENHIKDMMEYSGYKYGESNIACISSHMEGNNISFEYIDKPSLTAMICDCINKNNKAGARKMIDDFYQTLKAVSVEGSYDTEQFRTVFGEADHTCELCLAPANIDMILDNIFIADNGYQVIDYEWMFDFNVPTKFVIWRSINDLYEKRILEKVVSRRELLERYNISADDEKKYRTYNEYFCNQYVGSVRYKSISTEKIHLSLDEAMREWKKTHVTGSCLYVDMGDGYSENNKLYVESEVVDGVAEVTFDLSDYTNWNALRWDPAEDKMCMCEILDCTEGITLEPKNAEYTQDGTATFIDIDPIYEVTNENRLESFCIKYKLTFLGYSQVQKIIERENAEYNQKIETQRQKYEASIEQIKCQQQQSEYTIAELRATLDAVYSSKGWKMLEKIRHVVKRS